MPLCQLEHTYHTVLTAPCQSQYIKGLRSGDVTSRLATGVPHNHAAEDKDMSQNAAEADQEQAK